MMDHKLQCEQDCKTGRLPQAIRDALYQQAYDDGHAHGASEVGSRYEDLAELVLAAVDACVKVKVESIVAFHRAEAVRFDNAADRYDDLYRNADAADRCRTKAGHTRTLAAQIERGDDEAPR